MLLSWVNLSHQLTHTKIHNSKVWGKRPLQLHIHPWKTRTPMHMQDWLVLLYMKPAGKDSDCSHMHMWHQCIGYVKAGGWRNTGEPGLLTFLPVGFRAPNLCFDARKWDQSIHMHAHVFAESGLWPWNSLVDETAHPRQPPSSGDLCEEHVNQHSYKSQERMTCKFQNLSSTTC